MTLPRARELALLLVLALLYIVAGRVGLQLDAVGGFATLVWAPSGIALAFLLRFGLVLWPGVTIGAFVVNLWAGAPLPAAIGIAIGNTLEPVVATLLLRRFGFQGLTRVRDVLLLFTIGAAFSTTIAATIGALSLMLAGVISQAQLQITWVSWWLGDAIADLIVAPLLLGWLIPTDYSRPRRRVGEAIALAAAAVAASLLVFGRHAPVHAVVFLQPYLVVPTLIWAAVRFQERGAATAVFVSSAIAVWGTAAGLGPFVEGELFARLAALQALMAMMAVTFLMLAAIAAERARGEQQLRKAKEDAEEASRAKTRFLAVVSHELRTPLTAVVGYADLMLDGIAGEPNEQQTGYLKRIEVAAWHLISVIDGILTFSRADSGREELRIEEVDAAALTEETAALLAPQVDGKSLQLVVTVPSEPLFVRTDAGKLRQILLNLLGNAVKFSDAGTITVVLQRTQDRFQISVTDEGPGIPYDRLEDVFEPFIQLPGTRLYGGTGLGLSATRMLAVLMGGTVTVMSELGRGSTFEVDLPIDSSLATSR